MNFIPAAELDHDPPSYMVEAIFWERGKSTSHKVWNRSSAYKCFPKETFIYDEVKMHQFIDQTPSCPTNMSSFLERAGLRKTLVWFSVNQEAVEPDDICISLKLSLQSPLDSWSRLWSSLSQWSRAWSSRQSRWSLLHSLSLDGLQPEWMPAAYLTTFPSS